MQTYQSFLHGLHDSLGGALAVSEQLQNDEFCVSPTSLTHLALAARLWRQRSRKDSLHG